jgi:hypothetical protein
MGLVSSISTAPKLIEISSSQQIEPKVGLVLVNSATRHIDLTLPDASVSNNWLVIVAVDNTLGITLKVPAGSKFLDQSNIQFNNAGDSMIFASDRDCTWFCVARYTSHLNY